jgi:hypothetical protein
MMARISYLLNATLIWVFILAWAGLVVWVIATVALPPMGLLGAVAWPFFTVVLALPGILAYVGWVRRRNEEIERRRPADATVKLPTRREQPPKENGRNSEVAPQRLLALPGLSRDKAGSASTSSSPALAKETDKFLDDFEKELWERTRSPPPTTTSPEPPIKGGDEFLDDFQETVRQILDPDTTSAAGQEAARSGEDSEPARQEISSSQSRS